MNNRYLFTKIVCVILVVVSAGLLVISNGCSSPEATVSAKTEATTSSSDKTNAKKVGMEEVYKDGNFTCWRDLTTDVMYLEEVGYSERTLTVMLSPYGDGKPLLYSTWCNIQGYEDKGDK